MAIEIELKAHAGDHRALRVLLEQKTEYQSAFIKEDTYWFSGGIQPNGTTPDQKTGLPPAGLRVRKEKRSFPDGREEFFTFVTYKIKEVRDGIEINDEKEFEIRPISSKDTEHSSAMFEELLIRLGLKPGISKRKRGWSFTHKEINAELTEVDGLGWFVELELLADNNLAETVSMGQKKLLNLLAELGIKREAVESRFYSEMLRAKT